MNKEELQEAKQLLATLKSDKWWEDDTTERVLHIAADLGDITHQGGSLND